jgi:uncharacterized protein YgiM (DUF1202 family)
MTALMLLGGFDLMPPAGAAQGAGDTVATTAPLDLRTAPGLETGILVTMPVGTQVEVLAGPINGYYQVALDGRIGWAHGDFLAAPGAAAMPAVNGADGYSAEELVQIIDAAADTYGQPREDMLRVATCESELNPAAVNASSGASGLFQFMPGTWATTPFADQDIFDPVANANAAAWMWSQGRRGEWSCQ